MGTKNKFIDVIIAIYYHQLSKYNRETVEDYVYQWIILILTRGLNRELNTIRKEKINKNKIKMNHQYK